MFKLQYISHIADNSIDNLENQLIAKFFKLFLAVISSMISHKKYRFTVFVRDFMSLLLLLFQCDAKHKHFKPAISVAANSIFICYNNKKVPVKLTGTFFNCFLMWQTELI